MADSLFSFISFLHASSSHFSDVLSTTWRLFVPVFITCNIVIIISHYFAVGTRNPLIAGGKGKLRDILEILSVRVGGYHPTIWTLGGHLQTVFGELLRGRPKVTYVSEDIHTPDGGILRLDWTLEGKMGQSDDTKRQEDSTNEQTECAIESREGNDAPTGDLKKSRDEEELQNIVLILPGLTGDSHSSYAVQFAEDAIALGYRVVVMNHRGTSPMPVTYRFCCAANTDDLELVVEHIHKKHPKSRICAVGVSLGGIITTNYLIRMSLSHKDSHLLAAFVISVPYDPFISANNLERPISYFLFNQILTRRLQRLYVKNRNALTSCGIDVPEKHSTAVAKSNTIRQFDAAVTAPMFGYKDVDDYYRAASIVEKPFEEITTPLLCLSADDDPFSPAEQIPVDRIKNCDNVALLLTHTGGHVGFLEGLLPIGRGYMDKVYKEFIKAAFDEL